MSGPIVKAVMSAINDSDFERWPEFADWRWLRNYQSDNQISAAQSLALCGSTPDFRDYSEMRYFSSTRTRGVLTDQIRAYGILGHAVSIPLVSGLHTNNKELKL